MLKNAAILRCSKKSSTPISTTPTSIHLLRKALTDLVGYEPSQILLIHGNHLEAEHIGELLDLLRKRGYRFIPLGQALSDAV